MLLLGFHCGIFIYNTGYHSYTPVAIVTSLRCYNLTTMITGPQDCWVSNAIVLKNCRSASEYGVCQWYYGPLCGNERLDSMGGKIRGRLKI